MDIRNSLYCVKSIELEITSTEALRKGVVGRIVLVLKFKLLGSAAAVVHVVSPVNRRSDIYAVFRVLVTVAVLDMELSFFEVLLVLGVRVDPFTLQLLLDDLALYESF